jgi:hypothetical protein
MEDLMANKPRDMASDILDAVTEGTKRWTRTIKAEERTPSARMYRQSRITRVCTVSLKEAAGRVMKEAYMKASGNGTLPANARQIMYAARPRIQEETGKDLDDGYFTQVLLPDYIEEKQVNWDVVYDARGHFIEPGATVSVSVPLKSVTTFADCTIRQSARPNSPLSALA